MLTLSAFLAAFLFIQTTVQPIPFETVTIPRDQKTIKSRPIALRKAIEPRGDTIHSSIWMANNTAVLGAQTNVSPTPTPSPTPKSSGKKLQQKKTSVTIALLGDSMTDTLGKDAKELITSVRAIYPTLTTRILNYGAGGTNLEDAITRITAEYTYLGVTYPPLVSQKPDIIVIESCGYNPFIKPDGALDRHWLALAHTVDAVRAHLPNTKIVIAATIAPNDTVFGDGAAGLSFGQNDKRQRVAVIKQYLDNAVRFAKSEKLPLADAYTPSLGPDGNGKLEYINAGDHIHYSPKGRTLMAQKIAEAISQNKLLEN